MQSIHLNITPIKIQTFSQIQAIHPKIYISLQEAQNSQNNLERMNKEERLIFPGFKLTTRL